MHTLKPQRRVPAMDLCWMLVHASFLLPTFPLYCQLSSLHKIIWTKICIKKRCTNPCVKERL